MNKTVQGLDVLGLFFNVESGRHPPPINLSGRKAPRDFYRHKGVCYKSILVQFTLA